MTGQRWQMALASAVRSTSSRPGKNAPLPTPRQAASVCQSRALTRHRRGGLRTVDGLPQSARDG